MLICMRTTLNLEDGLMKEMKQEAAQRGTTLTAVMEEALREHLRRARQATSRDFRLRLVTAPGGPLPGVDLDDRDALYERMEERA
jgi:hypothetical protein